MKISSARAVYRVGSRGIRPRRISLRSCVSSLGLGPDLHLFFDAGSLAGQIAQVVELGATHVAATLDRDRADRRAVGLEHALHAFAVRNLADGERRVEAAVAARDDDALVGLHALAI